MHRITAERTNSHVRSVAITTNHKSPDIWCNGIASVSTKTLTLALHSTINSNRIQDHWHPTPDCLNWSQDQGHDQAYLHCLEKKPGVDSGWSPCFVAIKWPFIWLPITFGFWFSTDNDSLKRKVRLLEKFSWMYQCTMLEAKPTYTESLIGWSAIRKPFTPLTNPHI